MTKKDKQIDKFKETLEIFIKTSESNLYYHYHDNFYFEITADLYSLEKTEEYLKKYPNIYNKLKNKLEYEKLLSIINYTNYDIQLFFNYLFKMIIKNEKKLYKEKEMLIEILELIDILCNKEYKFKTINELSQNENWTQFEEELQNIILSSKCYLDNINISNLSQEELKVLLKALKYSYLTELNRYNKNKEIKVILRKQKKKLFFQKNKI